MSSFLEKMKQQKLLSVTLLLATLIVGIVLGTLINTGVRASKDAAPVAPDASPITIPQAATVGNEFSKLVEQIPGSRTAQILPLITVGHGVCQACHSESLLKRSLRNDLRGQLTRGAPLFHGVASRR